MARKATATAVSKTVQGMRTAITALLAATAISAAAGCHTDTQTVGPMGGLVVSEDGRFSLEIPAGALDRDVDISIEEVECERSESMGPCYDVQPRGTAFVYPAELAYEIGDMDLADVEPGSLGVIAERDDGWRVLADREVDTDDEVVYASAMYLSTFALVPVE